MSRILLIDGNPDNGHLIPIALAAQGHDVQLAVKGSDGLAAAQEKAPSLVLLAVSLPDQPGLDVFRALRSRARTSHVPVLFLAGRTESGQQNTILQAGADDFIVEPFDMDIVGLRIRNAIKRAERDGLHHPHTGLPTGEAIHERVRALSEELGWYKIDFAIENFAAFRDVYGFMSGQEVVRFAADLIDEMVRAHGLPDDFVGHRADGEFTIITRATNGPTLREQLESRFNERILAFYTFTEREQGYVEVDDGSGGKAQKSLMRARIKVQVGEPEE